MPRNPKTFSTKALRIMTTMMRAGATAAQIAGKLADIGETGASVATVGRWLREERGSRRSSKRPPKARAGAKAKPGKTPVVSDAPEGPPAGMVPSKQEALAEIQSTNDLEGVEKLLARAEKNLALAEFNENAPAVTNLMRVQRDLLKERRRLIREANPDANKLPDIIALGDELETKLLKILRDYAAERGPR